MNTRGVFLFVAFGVAACSNAPPEPAAQPAAQPADIATVVAVDTAAAPATPADTQAVPAPTASLDRVGSGGSLDPAKAAGPIVARATQRLTVDMLERSLPVVLGKDAAGKPIHWYGTGQVPLTDESALGRALGRPDYNTVTDEDTKPSILYAKFMDDMARDVCQRLIDSDAKRPQSERTLVRFAPLDGPVAQADLQKNLRYMSLRFWGRYVPEPGAAPLASAPAHNTVALEVLWKAAAGAKPDAIGAATEGWRAVCVGLLVSPAFHLY